MIRKNGLRLVCLFTAGSLLFSLCGCEAHEHSYALTVVPPTCSSIGYTIHACTCGETFYSDYQAQTEHEYGDWVASEAATLTAGGEEYRACKNCGELITRDTENTSALPKLYLSSDGTLLYSAGGMRFTCTAVLSTLADGVKPALDLLLTNGDGFYNVDLGWGEQSRYRLEPCIPDPTMARAAAAERLLLACAATRTSEEWACEVASGNFPVQLYRDGSYCGVYLLTPPEDGWKYAYSGYHGSPTAALRAEDTGLGCLFQARPTYTEGGEGFTVLYSSTGDTLWATESFDGFSVFVRTARDSAFREQLSQYTDVEALIDYFLLTQFFGIACGDTAGTVWMTADGIHWLPSMDSLSTLSTAYGLTSSGREYLLATAIPAPAEDGSVSYTGNSLLWQRLCEMFGEEIRARYRALRGSVLQPEALYADYLAQYERIEGGLLDAERLLYPTLPDNGTDTENILTFLQNRVDAMDNWLMAV